MSGVESGAGFEHAVGTGQDQLRQQMHARLRQPAALRRTLVDPGEGDAAVAQHGAQLPAVGRAGRADDP